MARYVPKEFEPQNQYIYEKLTGNKNTRSGMIFVPRDKIIGEQIKERDAAGLLGSDKTIPKLSQSKPAKSYYEGMAMKRAGYDVTIPEEYGPKPLVDFAGKPLIPSNNAGVAKTAKSYYEGLAMKRAGYDVTMPTPPPKPTPKPINTFEEYKSLLSDGGMYASKLEFDRMTQDERQKAVADNQNYTEKTDTYIAERNQFIKDNGFVKSLAYGGERAAAGLLGVGEGITDFVSSGINNAIAGGLSLGSELFGASMGDGKGNFISNGLGTASDLFRKGAEKTLEKNHTAEYEESIKKRYNPSELSETVTGVAQGVTNMLPAIGASVATGGTALPAILKNSAGLLSMGLSQAGNSASEAYKDGSDTSNALLYGTLSGAAEIAIEKVFGGIPELGGGMLDNVVGKLIKNDKVRNAVNKVVDMAGEGAEEALSTIIAPNIKNLTLNDDAPAATKQDILGSAITGAIVSGALQGGFSIGDKVFSGKNTNLLSPESLVSGEFGKSINSVDPITQKAIDGELIQKPIEQIENEVLQSNALDSTTKKQTISSVVREKINSFVDNAVAKKNTTAYIPFKQINDDEAAILKEATGLDVRQYSHALSDNDIRRILNKHGDDIVEKKKGQVAVTIDDIKKIPDIIENYDSVTQGSVGGNGRRSIKYSKELDDGNVYYVEVEDGQNKILHTKTMWKKPLRLDMQFFGSSGDNSQLSDSSEKYDGELGREDFVGSTDARASTASAINVRNAPNNYSISSNQDNVNGFSDQIANKNSNGVLQSTSPIIADLSLFDENVLKDTNTARKNFIKYAHANFPKSVVNKSENIQIDISRTGLDKVLSGNINKTKYASAFHAPQLIESAVKVSESAYYKDKENINGYQYFENSLEIEGKLYKAYIRVRETPMGNKYYGHTLSSGTIDKIKIEPARIDTSKEMSQPVNAIGSTSNTSIPLNQDNVNGFSDQIANKNSNGVLQSTAPVIKLENDVTSLSNPNQTTQQVDDTDVTKPLDLKTAYAKLKQARNVRDKVVEKTELSMKDKNIIDALLKGSVELSDLPNIQGINISNVEQVYAAKKPVADLEKLIFLENKNRKEILRDNAMELIEQSDKWKDKKNGFAYSRETMERNFEDIVKDKESAKEINDYYFKPIHDNEAKSTRFKNNYRNEIKKLQLNKYESVYTQLYGEYKYNKSQTGNEECQNIAANLEIKLETFEKKYGNKVNKDKSAKAVEGFKKIYDDLFEQVNEVLMQNGYKPVDYRKGYFPHFTDETPDTVFGKIAKAIGVDFSQQELPTDIAGLTHTFKPGKKWVANFLERKGEATTYDALKGFDRYIESVADVIHHTEDIQRLRDLENAIRYKYSDEGTKNEIDDIYGLEIDEAERQEKLKSLLERNPAHLPHLVQELRSYTDSLAGKKSILDRGVEKFLGRGIYNLMEKSEHRIAANMVAINPGSWLTNFIPLTQGIAETSTISMLKAAKDTFKSIVSNDGFVDKSNFLTNRKGSDPIVKTSVEKASEIMSKPMYWIDNWTSNVLTRARTIDNMKKGFSEIAAISEADNWTGRVMADRSKGALPTVFNVKNPIIKTLTMFQVEVNNQLSYVFKDVPKAQKEKSIFAVATAMTKMFLAAFLYNELYEKLTGRRPALDPIGMVKQTFEEFTNKDIDKLKAIKNVGKSFLQQTPFVGGLLDGGRLPVSSALPDIPKIITTPFSDKDIKKKLEIETKEFGKLLTYVAPPFGGGQVKKIIETADAIKKGGSYTYDNEGEKQLQFPVDNKFGSYAKGLLFGKYALPGAKKYVETGFNSLPVKQTAGFDLLKKSNFTPSESFNIINDLKIKETNGEKRDYLFGLDGVTPLNKIKLDDLLVSELKNKRDYTSAEAFKVSGLEGKEPEKFEATKKALDIDIDNFIKYYDALSNIEGIKDSDGKTISGSVKGNKVAKLIQMGMTQSEATKFYELIN